MSDDTTALHAEIAQRLFDWTYNPALDAWQTPDQLLWVGDPPPYTTDPAATAQVWQWVETRGAPMHRLLVNNRQVNQAACSSGNRTGYVPRLASFPRRVSVLHGGQVDSSVLTESATHQPKRRQAHIAASAHRCAHAEAGMCQATGFVFSIPTVPSTSRHPSRAPLSRGERHNMLKLYPTTDIVSHRISEATGVASHFPLSAQADSPQ